MSVDKLVDSTQLDSDLTSVANAIRAKSGGSSQLAFPSGFVSEIQAIPSGGGGPQWELIGTYSKYLAEYTDTSSWEQTNTGIDIVNTDFAFIMIVVTCDAAITTTTEWGMSIIFGGRFTSNGNFSTGMSIQQRGSATLSKAAMVNNSMAATAYGLTVPNNASTVIIQRKAQSSYSPKFRAGTYTVKVYGLKSL